MELIRKESQVEDFFLWQNSEVIVYKDKACMGTKIFDRSSLGTYSNLNGVLIKSIHLGNQKYKVYVYENGRFVETKARYYHRPTFISPSIHYSEEYNANLGDSNVSFWKDGTEYLFSVNAQSRLGLFTYDFENSLICIKTSDGKQFFVYTIIGQKIWEYKEQEGILKMKCLPIVDDVVVVISQEVTAAMKLQGFDIRTGELLWKLDVSERVCPNTFFIGDDKMLYGCDVYYGDTTDLNLCKLNPVTGELQSWSVLTDEKLDVMPWLVTMHDNKLYYTDNRRGNEIGVIDVDKKELVERMPLNIDKKVTIGAPVVTDDKVYVFIKDLQELRVYEK